jgi:hypothetical protein
MLSLWQKMRVRADAVYNLWNPPACKLCSRSTRVKGVSLGGRSWSQASLDDATIEGLSRRTPDCPHGDGRTEQARTAALGRPSTSGPVPRVLQNLLVAAQLRNPEAV